MSDSTAEAPPVAATYVYGVAAAGAIGALDVEGVAGAAVQSVSQGGIAALVSALPPGEWRVRRRDLTRHLHVLEAAFAQSTVVPCAFGMVVPSEEAVRETFLEARHDELVALLERLDGFVQLNVRASFDEELVLREIVAEDPTIAGLSSRTRALGGAGYGETIRLGELVAGAVAVRQERYGNVLRERLSPRAADVRFDEGGDGMVLKASFLVARDGLDRFEAELDVAAREHAPLLQIDSVGPLPPTAFAELGRDAWAS